MKTLVGVDSEGTYRAALNLCARLRFPDQAWLFAHAIPETPLYAAGLAPMALPIAEVVTSLRAAGREALQAAREAAGGVDAAEFLTEGGAAGTLIRLADENEVDLIAAGSQHGHGPLAALGSVTRALSIGAKQSLLVAKKPVEPVGPVRAVFATDHSKYAKCALEKLIAWAPRGLERIDVVSAYHVSTAAAAMLKVDIGVDLEFDEWVAEHSRKECQTVARALREIAPVVEARVEKGDANAVIREAMADTGADLLILGAQGHGFIDRLLVGSVSLHQILSEHYPVMLIRLP